MTPPWEDRTRRIAVYNGSGERIPPYAVMELDYLYGPNKSALEQDETMEVFWNVQKPTSASEDEPAKVVINGPLWIEIDNTGFGQINYRGIVLVSNDGSANPGDTVGPVSGSWAMTVDGHGWKIKTYDSATPAYTISSTQKTVYVEPAARVRRQWLGYLMETFRGTTIGFWVVPALALDGELPTGNQYAVNIFKWDFGVIGATVQVQEDVINARWLGLQMEYICDDGRTVATQTPPP